MSVVSEGSYQEYFHDLARLEGDKLSHDSFSIEVDGYPNTVVSARKFPVPFFSSGEARESATVLGTNEWSAAGQTKAARQGAFELYETNLSPSQRMLYEVICGGGQTHAWVYLGTPEAFVWRRRIRYVSWKIDDPEAAWDNPEILHLTGEVYYHYFNEEEKGNVPHLLGKEGGQGGDC